MYSIFDLISGYIFFLKTRILTPTITKQAGLVPGLKNWQLEESAMFISEISRKGEFQRISLRSDIFGILMIFICGFLSGCSVDQPAPEFKDGGQGVSQNVIAAGHDDSQTDNRDHLNSDALGDLVDKGATEPDEETEKVLIIIRAASDAAETSAASGAVKRSSSDEADNSGADSTKASQGSSKDALASPGTNTNPVVITVPDAKEEGKQLYFHTVSLTQADAAKVDILWVIDSSVSMAQAQNNLGNNMNSFITGLASSNQDFQTAVTTTDICTELFQGLNDPCPDPDLFPDNSGSPETNLRGRFFGDDGRKLLKSTDSDLVDQFNINARVGTTGSAFEHGLKATELAVQKIAGGENESLIRDDGFLSVIIVSDEEDDGIGLGMDERYFSPVYNAIAEGKTTFSYTNDELITYLDSVKGKGRYSISAITRTRGDDGIVCDYEGASTPVLYQSQLNYEC